MKALVTSGGTSEPIDDVRVVTNLATGRFTNEIAAAMKRQNHEVTLLGSRMALAYAESNPELDSVHKKMFGNTDSLWANMAGEPADVIICGAAVSDYKPVAQNGKIASTNDTLDVHFTKVDKLIDRCREHYGQKAFIVGFKLTSGATARETIKAARELCVRARLNLVVANDLSELAGGQHPVWLVTAEGGALRVNGTKTDVAETICAFIDKRRNVHWGKTLRNDKIETDAVATTRFEEALALAKNLNLHQGTDGNIICRGHSSERNSIALACSPRQVEKSELGPESAISVKVILNGSHDELSAYVEAKGPQKPSIDTSVVARVLAGSPGTTSSIHFHHAWGKPTATGSFCYPCGAKEEAEEILVALAEAGEAAGGLTENWLVELPEHGMILGLNDDGGKQLQKDWDEICSGWEQHLSDVDDGSGTRPEANKLKPVFHGPRIVGVVGETDLGVAVWLAETARGKNVGQNIVEQLTRTQTTVVTIDACEVVDYWKHQGFNVEQQADGTWLCVPPGNLGTNKLLDQLA